MADTTTSLDPRTLQANLDALAATFPWVAEHLAGFRHRLPAVRAVATRDGGRNLRLAGADGRETWLGRTSIPRVRASSLVEKFQSGHGNVLLPGIGEGTEAKLLLDQFGPHRAVFVWEADPVHFLLALHLHDFAAAIRRQRLVPVISDEAGLYAAMMEILDRLAGHVCPDRILVWPWQRPTDMVGCRSALEAACRDTEARRSARLAELQAGLGSLSPPTAPESSPAVAVLSIHPHEETLAWAEALAEGISTVGSRPALITIQTPADVHPLARASRLATALDQRPELAILLDVSRSEVADVLPASTRAVAWLSHRAPISKATVTHLGVHDRVVTTDSTLAEQVGRLGLDPGRISIVAPPALAWSQEVPGWADRPIDVAIVANRAPTNPESYGFNLSTHITIWRAVLAAIQKNVDTFTDQRLPEMLERAERQTRVRLGDDEVRARLKQVLAGPVASSLIWQDLAQILARSSIRIACHGQGWSEQGPVAPPGLAHRIRIYRQAKCVLFSSPEGIVPGDLLLAVGAGAAVAWRAHGRDRHPGGFADFLAAPSEAIVFDRNQGAAAPISRLLSNSDHWHKLVTAARKRCHSEHSPQAAMARIRAAATSFPAESPA